MVYFRPCLLMDAGLFGREAQIAERIHEGKLQMGVYCILLPQNPSNLFEIMHVNELRFSYYRKRNMYLLGLAESRKNAVEIVCRIIAEAYEEEEEPDIRSRFGDIDTWKKEPATAVLYHDRV